MRSLLGRMATRTPKTKPMQWRMTRTRTRTGRSARSRRGERPRARRTLVACSACWRRVDAHRLLPVSAAAGSDAARRSTVLIARMTRPFGACAFARLRPLLLLCLSGSALSGVPLGCTVRNRPRPALLRAVHDPSVAGATQQQIVGMCESARRKACFLSLFPFALRIVAAQRSGVSGRSLRSPQPQSAQLGSLRTARAFNRGLGSHSKWNSSVPTCARMPCRIMCGGCRNGRRLAV